MALSETSLHRGMGDKNVLLQGILAVFQEDTVFDPQVLTQPSGGWRNTSFRCQFTNSGSGPSRRFRGRRSGLSW